MLTATTTRPQRVLLWLAPAFITIAMLGFAAAAASDPHAPGPIWILGVIVAAVGWWSYVSIPRRISVNGTDLLLERPIGSITVPIAEVRKVDARPWNRGFVTVTSENRKIYLLRGTRNLFAIINEIKQQNPSAMVVGAVPRVA